MKNHLFDENNQLLIETTQIDANMTC
jgi:hypothetical protein